MSDVSEIETPGERCGQPITWCNLCGLWVTDDGSGGHTPGEQHQCDEPEKEP